MKRHYLVIAQLILWLAIWLIIGLNENDFAHFLQRNLGAIVVQIALIFAVSYYLVERWLFQKKTMIFVLISILLIVGLAYLSSQFLPVEPQRALGRPNGPKPPSPILVHIVLISMAYFISTLLMLFTESQKKEAQLEKQKTALIESELKFLKMQINPHFLFNALNNIYALSVTKSDKTQEGISSLSEMLRYVLYDCERPEVLLRKELEYITNYIELFKLKSSKQFNISFVESIKYESTLVAPMLFVPFIENAFKHSGIEKGGNNFIAISMKADDKTIEFSIENSLPSEILIKDKQGGIGLQNVQKRLEILYPKKHQLDIEKTDTFKVNLKVTII